MTVATPDRLIYAPATMLPTPADSQALLDRLVGGTFRFARSVRSSVTTSWGVRWDEEGIARDVMQNFFDANQGALDGVTVCAERGTVTITGPAACNLEQLLVIGSEKDPTANIGQYGEGFKAAATCLLRDYGVTPVALSGREAFCIRVAPDPVPGTKLHPLVYDFFETDAVTEGTRVILPGCGPRLVTALETGLTHFLHDRNPLVGALLWKSRSGDYALHASTRASGFVFYRRLRRAEISDVPVVLVLNKPYDRIEKLIQKDRDRNAFGEKLLKAFYQTFVRSDLKWSDEAQRELVEAARSCWSRGHPLLHALADARPRWSSEWPKALATAVFGDRHFARSEERDLAEQMRCDQVERAWRDEGKVALPAYFARFGLISAKQHLKNKEAEATKLEQRTPSPAESASIDLLAQVLHEFSPEIDGVFARGRTTRWVIRSEAALGALRAGRGYNSREVFLAEQLFVGDFAGALATFLHEHAHIFGHDGSRGFTDALTQLLETVVRARRSLDRYEARWEKARQAVVGERGTCTPGRHVTEVGRRVEALDRDDLRDVLLRLPAALVLEALPVVEKSWTDAAATPGAAVTASEVEGSEEGDTDTVGLTFEVELVRSGKNRLDTIKIVREITGLGLGQTKALVDGVPRVIKERVSRRTAENIRKKLTDVGATVLVRPAKQGTVSGRRSRPEDPVPQSSG